MTELETLRQELESHDWVFAKTMPENPHEYTTKRSWGDQREFEWTCLLIRARGHKAKFRGSTYIELQLGDCVYWTMGWPCRPLPGRPEHSATQLINRKCGAGKPSSGQTT